MTLQPCVLSAVTAELDQEAFLFEEEPCNLLSSISGWFGVLFLCFSGGLTML